MVIAEGENNFSKKNFSDYDTLDRLVVYFDDIYKSKIKPVKSQIVGAFINSRSEKGYSIKARADDFSATLNRKLFRLRFIDDKIIYERKTSKVNEEFIFTYYIRTKKPNSKYRSVWINSIISLSKGSIKFNWNVNKNRLYLENVLSLMDLPETSFSE